MDAARCAKRMGADERIHRISPVYGRNPGTVPKRSIMLSKKESTFSCYLTNPVAKSSVMRMDYVTGTGMRREWNWASQMLPEEDVRLL